MASGGDVRGGDRKYKENVPSSGWTYRGLRLPLPPNRSSWIQKGKVKLQVDNYGHVVVSGERKVNENKFIRFSQSYDAPENSNIDETGGKFEDGILQRK
ncbi:hypothetical protein Leryth_013077 [Lithospermum erythrorhizon]|nr:hypothetical protein Leryth_013077 [Lithospermum erythrorhizon]